MSNRYDDIADRLSELSEEIADLAIDSIRGALRNGQGGRPVEEKQLTQARRAVEKAIHVLRGIQMPLSEDAE